MQRILVIDNDPHILDLMDTYLSWRGYQVFCCREGERGPALAQQLLPDLVILDFLLGPVTGASIYRQLDRDPKTSDIPVLVCSVEGDREVQRKLGHPPPFFVEKPFNLNELDEVVQDALAGARPGGDAP